MLLVRRTSFRWLFGSGPCLYFFITSTCIVCMYTYTTIRALRKLTCHIYAVQCNLFGYKSLRGIKMILIGSSGIYDLYFKSIIQVKAKRVVL